MSAPARYWMARYTFKIIRVNSIYSNLSAWPWPPCDSCAKRYSAVWHGLIHPVWTKIQACIIHTHTTPITTPNTWQKSVMDQARSPEVDQYLERQESCRCNQDVYEKISSELSEARFSRTYQQWRENLKNLNVNMKGSRTKEIRLVKEGILNGTTSKQ